MNLRIYARALYFFLNRLEHSNSFAGEFIISFAFLNIYDACLSEDSESFVAELEHYGGLKSAIQELSKQADKTRMELDLLEAQNSDLNADNQRIVSNLVNSRYTLDFMQGSLRNESVVISFMNQSTSGGNENQAQVCDLLIFCYLCYFARGP
jgi:hypothetical protein